MTSDNFSKDMPNLDIIYLTIWLSGAQNLMKISFTEKSDSLVRNKNFFRPTGVSRPAFFWEILTLIRYPLNTYMRDLRKRFWYQT